MSASWDGPPSRAITGAPVLVDEFEADPARGAFPGDPAPDHDAISHLELVRRADVFVVAPASANTIAKLAGGLADNLLTSAALASPAPLVVAPAMNDLMWKHPATVANVATLVERGATVIAPGTGAARLARRVRRGPPGRARRDRGRHRERPGRPGGGDYSPLSLDGLRVLVTAGGTREPIDSVRYVGNRSSGRMGYALAVGGRAPRGRGHGGRRERRARPGSGGRLRRRRDRRPSWARP